MKKPNQAPLPSLPDSGCKYKDCFLASFERNREALLFCLIATFVWGLVAHSYIFLNSTFSHDSLNEFNAAVFGNEWKLQLGRVFVPVYRLLLRGPLTLPWIIGLLSLLYIGIAVFLTVKIFHIQSKVLMVLTSGVFTTNITVIATTATYLHDLDCNMFGMMMAVLSVFLWKRYDKGFLFGIIPLFIAIGLYQSFISVTITLVMICLILELLDGECFETAFLKGLKSVVMILGSGILYFLAIKILPFVTEISLVSNQSNSLDTVLSLSLSEIVFITAKGYIRTCYKILAAPSMYPATAMFLVNLAAIAIAGIIILYRVFQKEIKIREKILTLLLILLLPIGMNVVYTLTGGDSHDVMHYALWLVYLFVLLVTRWAAAQNKSRKSPWKHCVSVCLIFVILWGNVQTANAAYLKKDLEQQANLSLFTRIIYQMESHAEYVAGETPVVFVGTPDSLLDTIPGFEPCYRLTGSDLWYVLGVGLRSFYQAYFDYILLNPAVMADPDIWSQMCQSSEIEAMPPYPEAGSVEIVDGIMVVRLS